MRRPAEGACRRTWRACRACTVYGIYGGDRLLYVGASKSLGRRLGQAVGAISGAPGLHPAGRRIFFAWDTLPRPLRFVIFAGEANRLQERDVIVALGPEFNIVHKRRGTNVPELDPED